MSWLDKVVNLAVQSAGSLIGTRPTVNFTGASVTVTDDSVNNRVNVAIASSSAPDATTTTKGIVQLAGDIAGTATSVQVAKVNGVSVSGTPTAGQVITASNGTTAAWATPAAPSDASTSAKGIVQLAGDIAGTASSVTVAKINGVSVTGTPTAGQVITASSGTAAAWATPSGGGGTRLPIDANHVDVWYMDATDGSSFANQISGRPSFVGGSDLVVLPGFCYKNTKSAVWSGAATKSVTLNTATYNFDKNTSITADFVIWLPNFTKSNELSWDYYNNAWYITSPVDFFGMRTEDNGQIKAAWPYYGQGGAINTTHFLDYGGYFSQFSVCAPHHVMQVWDLASSQARTYVDGFLIGVTNSVFARAQNFSNIGLVFYQNFSYADFRVSNIARLQSYAQAATRAMLSL